MEMALWVQCMYRSAQKNSGDVTATSQLNHYKSPITGPQKPQKRDASVASHSNLTK